MPFIFSKPQRLTTIFCQANWQHFYLSRPWEKLSTGRLCTNLLACFILLAIRDANVQTCVCVNKSWLSSSIFLSWCGMPESCQTGTGPLVKEWKLINTSSHAFKNVIHVAMWISYITGTITEYVNIPPVKISLQNEKYLNCIFYDRLKNSIVWKAWIVKSCQSEVWDKITVGVWSDIYTTTYAISFRILQRHTEDMSSHHKPEASIVKQRM